MNVESKVSHEAVTTSPQAAVAAGLDRAPGMEAYLPLAQDTSFTYQMVIRTTVDPIQLERAVRDDELNPYIAVPGVEGESGDHAVRGQLFAPR